MRPAVAGQPMTELRFAKGHGLGNDYLVVESARSPWPWNTARIRAICDRHRGPGSDGLLVLDTSAGGFGLRIYNPDGSEAEKSGNGLRILGAYLHDRGLVRTGEPFAVRLVRDEVAMTVHGPAGGGALDISVEMGAVSFRGADAGFSPEPGEAFGYDLPLPGGGSARVNPLSLANPHCVVFVDALDRSDFLARAPALATHEAFPAGTNVQFARVAGPDTLEAWIWERGAGETLASGSSACAVAAAAVRTGRISAARATVRMPGGSVAIELEPDWRVRLRGPAVIVYDGTISPAVAESWRSLE